MKTVILLLAIAVYATATPTPPSSEPPPSSEGVHERVLLDLEELGLEFFPNGTVRVSTSADLVRLYLLRQNYSQSVVNFTLEHLGLASAEEAEKVKEEELSEWAYKNDRGKRTVFDDDERLPIPNANLMTGLPFCALAEVSNGCTAIFIGPNHALTAGRCVYDRSTSRFRTGLALYRGRNCARYGTYMSTTNLFTVNGYALSGRAEYDYGMIVTASRSPCWASLGYNDPWNNRGLELLGYPTDKRTGCTYHPAYFSSCATSSTSREDLYLQHRCDAFGTTGGPLMTEYTDAVGRDRGQKGVVGVNVYSGSIYNYGPRINRDRFFQLIDWMRQTGYDPLA